MLQTTTARPGPARPTPRHGGAAGRRHANHPEARRRLYQRQHPTGLRRRAGGAWTPGAGPAPVDRRLGWPSTSASSSRRAVRPPPPPWPSPPSGFGPRSPASRPPPGQRPPACWAATGARPPTGAGARPPRCARTGSPRCSPPPNGPARTAGASNPTPRRTAGADSTP